MKTTPYIMSLSENVIKALEFFVKNPPPSFNTSKFKLPFVVGSGNAYNTGLILFSKTSALYADESTFKTTLSAFKSAITNKVITQAVIISASGEKDSVWEVEIAKKFGLKTTLLTTKKESSATKIADTVLVYSSIDEPYTYNVSTYLGMILSSTGENPQRILNIIKNFKLPKSFSSYSAYSFVVPDAYSQICPMLDIKKSELFGPNLSLRAFSEGHARHAKFVIRSPKELVISIGVENSYYGLPTHRLSIPLQKSSDYGQVLALTYYMVGKIQECKRQYYKEHINRYVSDYGPKAYGKTQAFELIVPGTL